VLGDGLLAGEADSAGLVAAVWAGLGVEELVEVPLLQAPSASKLMMLVTIIENLSDRILNKIPLKMF